MCARYTLADEGHRFDDVFAVHLSAPLAPRYNIAPSQPVVMIIQDEATRRRRAEHVTWGLVPGWAKDPSIAYRMINARSETAAEKPAYRAAMRYRRCLIPADGYYEWPVHGPRQPYRITVNGGELFAMAGLWEHWEDPAGSGSEIVSCTLMTTESNALLAPIHHRMPVILPPSSWAAWIDPAMQDPDAVQPLLTPFPAERMAKVLVSAYVNRPVNEGPRCIEPLPDDRRALTSEQWSLFETDQ